ncbi:MAG: helix-turn-helix transcriptional regulator [Armatimonadetes bacterium]|nr:helix-turn-helix transcriptional regulator [Armatimonadota bacterium]
MILKRVPLPTLRAVLRACAIHDGADTQAIARASGIGDATASKALAVLAEFGLVHGDRSGWGCDSSTLGRGSDDSAVDSMIRAGLLAYRPFESICEGLAVGETFEQASRNTAVMFQIDPKAEERLGLLRQWGAELGVLTSEDAATLSADLQSAVGSLAAMPVSSVTSTAETRLYISTIVGRDAFDSLDEVDRELLVSAVADCDGDPPSSVEASGQALEDYLRELCVANGLANEATRLNGAGQLAGLLRQHDLIHPHHVKLVESASALRNAKAHKKDRQTVTPWNISPLGARTAFGMTVLVIKSVHDWVSSRRQNL